MRKYIKPEIEELALETIDVIATSSLESELNSEFHDYGFNAQEAKEIDENLGSMGKKWSWN
ncbi:MAG: hypothetical protein UIL37_07345 [Clostridia bacterium]|nr:hypothetical protein [Clostridia bacterium]